MACSANSICYLCWLRLSICAGNWLRLVLESSLGVLITIHWSKTIQFLEWIVEIPLPYIPCSKLCPTAAITNAFCFTATVSAFNSQAFNWVDQKQLVKIFTYESFVSTLQIHFTSLGFDPKLFAGHSFRRGGAPFAYQVAVPIKLIKALGNWHSDTILIYLTMPLTIRLYSANMLSKAILPHTPHHFHNTNPSTSSTSGFGP